MGVQPSDYSRIPIDKPAENPKKAFGDSKPSLHYFPMNIMLQTARVMELGAEKYGLKNWREQPVRASTYYSAILRHLIQWFELGEDSDIESRQSHLAHVIAGAAILMDGLQRGELIDDRADVEVKTKQAVSVVTPSQP